ncbi:MAG: serine/threonine protein kinase [Nitrospinae bacterium]|nr:serine/threonine protein kinase [Nitrospinota bacterium]
MDPKQTEILADNINKTMSFDSSSVGQPAEKELAAGTSLKSRYSITAKLGEGGMGAVYAGFDNQLGQKIAVKLLKRSMSADEKAVNQLKSEAQVAMKLTHPSIMRLINFEHDGEYAFLLMELVDGKTLESLAKNFPGQKMPSKLVAQIGYKVSEALEYAHENHVIHRDIKPANIMVDPARNSIKLMDFGIARVIASQAAGKQTIMGTLPYIAPEIFEGATPDARADIYALGLTLYELLAGRHPFPAKTAKEMIQMHFEVHPPALEGVERTLMNIIFQCVEKKPNARFQTVSEIKSVFAKYLDLGEAKVIREKKQVEGEKKKLEWELKRLEREKEMLKEKRDEVAVKTASFKTHSSQSGLSISSDLVKPVAAAALAGLFAAFVDSIVRTGDIGLFGSARSYGALSAMLAPALINLAPVYLKKGRSPSLLAAFTGMAFGFVLFNFGEAYLDRALANDKWAPFSLIAGITLAVPTVAGVAVIIEGGSGRILRAVPVLLGVAGLCAFLQSSRFAETALGMADERAGFFYIPFLAAVLWGALTVWESRN